MFLRSLSVGATLDERGGKTTKKAKATRDAMDLYFGNMSGFARHPKLDKRTQFMCRDTIEVRENGWKERRKTLRVKTIAEIHKEAEEEERERERQAQQSNHRGGNNHRGGKQSWWGTTTIAVETTTTAEEEEGATTTTGAAGNDVRQMKVQVQGNLRVNRPVGGGSGGSRPGGAGMRPGGWWQSRWHEAWRSRRQEWSRSAAAGEFLI